MTKKKAETKSQHYVPRFILKKWSKDSKRISVLLLATGERKDEIGLRSQCAKPYFYDTDNVMEKSFAAEEGKISGYLGDLTTETLLALPFDPALYDIRQYVHYQRMRTAAAVADNEERMDAFMKNVMGTTIDANPGKFPFTRADLDLVKVKLRNGPNEALWAAGGTTPLLLDLDVKFIVTDRTPGFVISDHPVVAYNQWAEHHPKFGRYRGITGLAAKGLQLFMPLSPSVTVMIFDPSMYFFGSEKHRLCRPSGRDVKLLNEMQAVNADACLYFSPDRMTDPELVRLRAARSGSPKMRKATAFDTPITERPDGKLSNFVVVTSQDLKIGASFSFGRVTDDAAYADYDLAALPIRSEKLFAITEMYQAKLDAYVERERRRRSESVAPTAEGNEDEK